MVDERVLVVRRGALGDSICFLPVLDAIARSWPAAEIHFAGEAEVAALLAARGVVARGMSSESLALWRLRGTERSRQRVHERLLVYDRLIGEFEPEALPAKLAARCTAFDVRIDEASEEPAPRQLLGRARRVWPVAWPSPPEAPRLPRSPARRSPRRLWAHPGSGSPRKNWPGFAELLPLAARAGFELVVSFGEADQQVQCELAPVLPAGTVRCEQRPLVEVASRLETASVFVGNDSGMSHLAAALAVPALVLFGPSPAAVWTPLGDPVLAVPFAGAEPALVWERLCGLASRI